jgi:hypothetical protein
MTPAGVGTSMAAARKANTGRCWCG